jgi:hypothetical protein
MLSGDSVHVLTYSVIKYMCNNKLVNGANTCEFVQLVTIKMCIVICQVVWASCQICDNDMYVALMYHYE